LLARQKLVPPPVLGVSTWLTGSYDPDQDILFWGIGNPGPDLNASVRKGDNLFSCSVVALDAVTGKRKWHYQFTPGDSHDWDAAEDLILADRVLSGQNRKLILQANRNGLFYVLDRTNGQFLLGKPFVRQTWNCGFDGEGRPIPTPEAEASRPGAVVYPGIGGTNWQAPSSDAATGTMYLAFSEAGFGFMRAATEYEPASSIWAAEAFPQEAGSAWRAFGPSIPIPIPELSDGNIESPPRPSRPAFFPPQAGLCFSRPQRQSDRTRCPNRRGALAFPNRRPDHLVSTELCGQRQAIRGRVRGQCAVQFCPPRIKSSNLRQAYEKLLAPRRWPVIFASRKSRSGSFAQ
jgi:hypothetical protein